MQRLYLSDNQITGQLPQQWSDDSALYELGRLDLYGNRMTGSIPWAAADLPHLANLVLLPGASLPVQALTYTVDWTHLHDCEELTYVIEWTSCWDMSKCACNAANVNRRSASKKCDVNYVKGITVGCQHVEHV